MGPTFQVTSFHFSWYDNQVQSLGRKGATIGNYSAEADCRGVIDHQWNGAFSPSGTFSDFNCPVRNFALATGALVFIGDCIWFAFVRISHVVF